MPTNGTQEGLWEPPSIADVSNTGDNLNFLLASKDGHAGGEQFCGTEPLTRGISMLPPGSVRIDLNYRTPRWCQRIA